MLAGPIPTGARRLLRGVGAGAQVLSFVNEDLGDFLEPTSPGGVEGLSASFAPLYQRRSVFSYV